MSKKKLFEDIKQNPARIYRTPADVPRDRRFADAERLEILRAWRDCCSDPAAAEEIETMIETMIVEIEGRLYAANDHAAE